jgi:hypothetical protein
MLKIQLIINQIGKFLSHIIEKYRNIDFNFSNKHILILLGDYGCCINVIHQNKTIDSLCLEGTEYSHTKYHKFLEKYKYHEIFFILDKSDIKLDHADIPISYNLIYQNPITQFIKSNFNPNTLVSSNVYNITYNKQEIHHTVFTSTPVPKELHNWLEYISSNKFELKNIYFLTLNAPQLLNNILENANIPNLNSLRLFVTVTKSSSVRIIISDHNNILESHSFTPPADKSNAYIQGIIEQVVFDSLISLKNYIHHNQVTPSLIILASEELKQLLNRSKFNIADVVILSEEDLIIRSKPRLKNDTDNIILSLLNNNFASPATQKTLDSYKRITKFNNLLSNPCYVIISILIITLLVTQLRIFTQNNQSSSLNEKFYMLSENYRGLKQKYPDIPNLEQIVNFHYATTELSTSQKLPFEDLNNLLKTISGNFILYKIHWELGKDNKSLIFITGSYKTNAINMDEEKTMLNQEINNLRRTLLGCTLEYKYSIDEVSNYGGYSTIPLQLIITK